MSVSLNFLIGLKITQNKEHNNEPFTGNYFTTTTESDEKDGLIFFMRIA